MDKMKCPFCQQELIPCIKNQNDWIYHCDNPKCPMYDDADVEDAKHPLASEDLWQELIRTKELLEIESSEHELCHDAMVKRTEEVNQIRKALDVACGALKEISLSYQNGLDKPVAPAKWFSIATDMCDYADNAIEQITALEQKD